SATLNFTKVPSRFFFDESEQTIVGLAGTEIVDYNFFSQEQNIHTDLLSLPNGYCYDTATHELYVLESNPEDTYTLTRTSLSSDASTQIIHHQPKDPELAHFTEELFCDLQNNSLYLLVHHDIE